MGNRAFTPTDRMIAAAEAHLAAEMSEREIRPIVIGFETEILKKYRFVAARTVRTEPEEIILDPNLSYRLGEADSAIFFAECQKARAAAQITIEGEDPDVCPLLKARHVLVNTGSALIKAMSELPALAVFAEKDYVMRLEDRQKVIELSLGLLDPFVSKCRTVALVREYLAQYRRFAKLIYLAH
ncbi:hypothetical protein [Burkholderia stabilis]|uniref:hypothetical protein n=1 Tax=Burkholderia stabilis TaxID=95485 RepID=UPI001F4AF504|nr:hypothetical protein [Burkholderia stabilis]